MTINNNSQLSQVKALQRHSATLQLPNNYQVKSDEGDMSLM